ncbi:hypothetical protein VTK73DRAFT_6174 [Phialemonium thermophilum]|uniref:Uncharacterized protein n=1 Tax=Phialemonium thermophilum TaxID=223376 RepID=A0ABR3V040_9PEZI
MGITDMAMARARSALPRVPHSTDPAVVVSVAGHHGPLPRLRGRRRAGRQHGLDLRHALGAQERHLLAEQQRHAGAHQDGVALEDVDVPEPRRLVESEAVCEQRREHAAEVAIRVVVGEAAQVVVQALRLARQRLHEQVVRGRLGTGVGGVEAQGERTVEHVGQRDEGGRGIREVQQQEGGNGLCYQVRTMRCSQTRRRTGGKSQKGGIK